MNKISKNLLIALLGMAIVVPVAKYVGRTAGEAANERDASQRMMAARLDPQIKTMVSRQDAQGVTEADLSPEFLKNIEAWTLERINVNAKKHWDAAGVPEGERNVSAESVYVSTGSHKLAIIRMRIGDVTPQATIFGIVGSEAVRVTCVDPTLGNVTVTSGPCAEKIRETFGESINPMGNNNG